MNIHSGSKMDSPQDDLGPTGELGVCSINKNKEIILEDAPVTVKETIKNNKHNGFFNHKKNRERMVHNRDIVSIEPYNTSVDIESTNQKAAVDTNNNLDYNIDAEIEREIFGNTNQIAIGEPITIEESSSSENSKTIQVTITKALPLKRRRKVFDCSLDINIDF